MLHLFSFLEVNCPFHHQFASQYVVNGLRDKDVLHESDFEERFKSKWEYLNNIFGNNINDNNYVMWLL